eukprot:530347_1
MGGKDISASTQTFPMVFKDPTGNPAFDVVVTMDENYHHGKVDGAYIINGPGFEVKLMLHYWSGPKVYYTDVFINAASDLEDKALGLCGGNPDMPDLDQQK